MVQSTFEYLRSVRIVFLDQISQQKSYEFKDCFLAKTCYTGSFCPAYPTHKGREGEGKKMIFERDYRKMA